MLALCWSAPDSVQAAPCPIPTVVLAGGDLSIEGTDPCAEEPERIAVYCETGTVRFEYEVNGVLQGVTDTAVGCGSPTRISVRGNAGDDTIDLSRVSSANGFTGITRPNLLDGGSGKDELLGSQMPNEIFGGTQGDVILARNGLRDTVECGAGTDAVEADQAGVDTLSNCELIDLPLTPAFPAPAPTSTPAATGKRSAAQKRCRGLKHRRARQRCLRRAHKLPI